MQCYKGYFARKTPGNPRRDFIHRIDETLWYQTNGPMAGTVASTAESHYMCVADHFEHENIFEMEEG
jgi:hypothetical protein